MDDILKYNEEAEVDFNKIENILRKMGILDVIKLRTRMLSDNKTPIAEAYFQLANFLIHVGQPDAAQYYYKLSLKLAFTPKTYSAYLQCLLLSPSCTFEQMYQVSQNYNQFFSDVKRHELHTNKLTTDRKLNIGYICHFFHNSISQSMLIPFVKAHNRDRIKVFCYSDAPENVVPNDIREIADVWHDTKDYSDEALSLLIRNEKIDVLIELNGHSVVNRFGVIARKTSPVQVSFYNISTTSGVSGFDYIMVADEITIDEKQSQYYTESVYFIKGVGGVVQFPSYFPECSPPPCLKNQYITFGTFNGPWKVNSDTIKLWCKILKTIPDAKFFMKGSGLSYADHMFCYVKIFESEGVDLSRLYFEEASDHPSMLERYSQIDIALDPFPHNAGTTTMEAIWQGIPVITLCGSRYVMQHGKAILTSLGHPEFVAYSEEEYVDIAVKLASDKNRLVNYRNQLREDFRNSPRTDIKAYATKLEDAYYDMWKRYCESA